MIETLQKHRPIRSFVRRTGRITNAQMQALATLWAQYGLQISDGKLNLSKLFLRDNPCVLEIGFGMGEALLTTASKNPDRNYIGIDVHSPGVGTVLAGIDQLGLDNVKLFCADAKEVLNNCIPANSLAAVHLFFPDPWPKTRHHKRRIVQPEFVALVNSKLSSGGIFHMATDWENYADHMLAVMSEAAGFKNTAGEQQFAERPDDRPETKFERRAHRLGHKIYDLIFVKTA